MRHLHRVDANQAEIIAALRRIGYSVLSLTKMGNGCPDLLASRAKQNLLLEVKSDRGELRESQSDFAKTWNAPVYVVRNADDVLALANRATH